LAVIKLFSEKTSEPSFITSSSVSLMESIKTPKRIIKKQLKNVNKAIIEIAEMKFVNIEEKEEKLDALVFLKNQILRKAEKLEIK
jgi:hypothetical protein